MTWVVLERGLTVAGLAWPRGATRCLTSSLTEPWEIDVRRSSLKRVPAALVTTAVLPVVAREFFAGDTGSEYGVGLPWKLKFVAVTIRNNIRVESASNFLYHLIM